MWALGHPVRWWWQTFKQQPGRASSILVIAAFVVGVAIAVVLRVTSPYPALVVTPFETPTASESRLSVSGKTIANLLVDELQYIVTESSKELTLSSRESSEARPLRFSPGLEPAAVGIEVGGFSLHRIVAEWSRIRQQRYEVTGDLVVSGGTLMVRTRLLPKGTWWEESAGSATIEGLKQVSHQLALNLLSDLRRDIAGLFYYRQRQWDQAIALFRQWAEEEPGEAAPHFYIGVALQGDGRYGDARDAYRKALAIDPDFLDALIALAENLFEGAERDEEFEEIVTLYEKALQLDPNLGTRTLALAHSSLATSLQYKGDHEAAQRHFAEAERLNPNEEARPPNR